MRKDTIKEIFNIIKTRFGQADLGNTSVLVAYYILLSIFPMVIIIGNIIPLLNIDPEVVMSYLNMIVPESVQSILDPVIKNLLTSGNGGVLSISMLGLLWATSQGVAHIEYGIDKAYGFSNAQSSITQRIVSVIGLIIVMFVAVVLVILFQFGGFLLKKLSPVIDIAGTVDKILVYTKWPVMIILLIVLITAIYVFMPSTKVKIRDAIPGSLFALVGWLVLVETFALYLKFTANTLNTYGILSTFFILIFWLNFAAMIILIGAVINASVYTYKYGEPKPDEERIVDKLEKGLIKKIRNKYKKSNGN